MNNNPLYNIPSLNDPELLAAVRNGKTPRHLVSLHLDITTACQLNCNFCWIHNPCRIDPPPPYHTPLKNVERILSEAHSLGVKRITLSGDGEPTLHPDFDAISRILQSMHIQTVLTTHGGFAPGKTRAAASFRHLLINISSADPATYSRVQAPRSPGIFQVLERNLGQLMNSTPRPAITLTSILNTTNFRSIPQLLDLAGKYQTPYLHFALMEPCPSTRHLVLGAGERIELARLIRSIKSREVEHNLNNVLKSLAPAGAAPLKACYIGWINLFVRIDGNVSFCCSNDRLSLGNVRQKSLTELWSSPAAAHLRQAGANHFTIPSKLFPDLCRQCYAVTANRTLQEALQPTPCRNRRRPS